MDSVEVMYKDNKLVMVKGKTTARNLSEQINNLQAYLLDRTTR